MKRLILPIFAMLFITVIPTSCVLFESMAEEGDLPSLNFDFINKCDQSVTVLDYFWFDSLYLPGPSFYQNWSSTFMTIRPDDSIKISSFSKERIEDMITHQLLIIKQSTIDKYGRDSIIKNDIYDKRYVITYPEVTAGLKIIYTGD